MFGKIQFYLDFSTTNFPVNKDELSNSLKFSFVHDSEQARAYILMIFTCRQFNFVIVYDMWYFNRIIFCFYLLQNNLHVLIKSVSRVNLVSYKCEFQQNTKTIQFLKEFVRCPLMWLKYYVCLSFYSVSFESSFHYLKIDKNKI